LGRPRYAGGMNLRHSVCLTIFLGVLWWGEGARASGMYYDALELVDMVDEASVVVVAKRAVPATTMEMIPIVPPGQKPEVEKYPPFSRVKSRWVVVETLKAARKISRGATLEIDGADWRRKLDLHRRYYVEGVSKSPIYRRYKGAKIENQDQAILFLRESDESLIFVADNAMESIHKRDAIKRLLAKRK
jgi:hypothetical protein